VLSLLLESETTTLNNASPCLSSGAFVGGGHEATITLGRRPVHAGMHGLAPSRCVTPSRGSKGVAATVATLKNGNYDEGGPYSLSVHRSAYYTLTAIRDSPWGGRSTSPTWRIRRYRRVRQGYPLALGCPRLPRWWRLTESDPSTRGRTIDGTDRNDVYGDPG